LRESLTAQSFYSTHGAANIFAALSSLANIKPNTLERLTEIYIYIVALSLDNDNSWLRKARAIAFPGVKWVVEIIDYLLSKGRPTLVQHAKIPPRIIIGSLSPNNSTANTTKTFIL